MDEKLNIIETENNISDTTQKSINVLYSMLLHVNKNFQLSEMGESIEMCNYVTMAQVLATTINALENGDNTIYEIQD